MSDSQAQTVGYPLPEDNGKIYRSAYYQSHMDKLRAAWVYANEELFAEYGADLDRQKFLRDTIADERDRLAKLDEIMAKDTPAARKAAAAGERGVGNAGDPVLVAELNNMAQAGVEDAKRRSENADRVIKARAEADTQWTAPQSSVAALNKIAAGLAPQSFLHATAADRATSVTNMINNDPTGVPALAALTVPEQKVDAGIKFAGAISASTGVSVAEARMAVATAMGLDPGELEPSAFQLAKATAKDDSVKAAMAATGSGSSLSADMAADARKRMGLTAAKSVAEKAQEEKDKKEVDAYLNSPEWAQTSAVLRQTGELNAATPTTDDNGKVTTPTITAPDGTEITVTPEMVQHYEQNRRRIQTEDIPIAESDANLMDDLFLSRVSNRHGIQTQIDKDTTELGKISPKMPTIEQVRKRQGEIYAPESGGTVKAAMTEQQKATMAATQKAITLARSKTLSKGDWDGWKNDGSKAQGFAAQINGMLASGAIKPGEVYNKICELAGTDMELRDDIYPRVLAYHVEDQDSKRATPVTKTEAAKPEYPVGRAGTVESVKRQPKGAPATDTSPASAPPAPTEANSNIKRRAQLEALLGQGGEPGIIEAGPELSRRRKNLNDTDYTLLRKALGW